MTTAPKLRLSPSKMMAWADCPAKFKQEMGPRRDDQSIYTIIGTAAHAIVERINKGEVLTGKQRAFEFKMSVIVMCEKHNKGLSFPAGYVQTEIFLQKYEIPDGYRLLRAEGKQVLSLPEFDFAYIIDAMMLDEREGIVDITDYKTSAKVPASALQLMLCYWAEMLHWPELKEYKVRVSYHMLRDGKVVYYEIHPHTFATYEKFMNDNVKLIKNCMSADYWPTIPGKGCHFCPINDICPVSAS